jgi:glycosyltransferase involved in cell wall biosynthesis
MLALEPSKITIAITVYDRRDYLANAITSALNQTLRGGHRVMIVEDCGPDPTLRDFVLSKFGELMTYHRNARRRGLFDNWNACMEACTTRWLCILHDDDYLEPTFLESMIELAKAKPARALYYGACHTVDSAGRQTIPVPIPAAFTPSELPLEAWTRYDPVCFPGQLFDVEAARALGGFRASSQYCGDWEMWFRLALYGGAVATNRVVANYREHATHGRGTTRVDVSGRKYAYVNVQAKRHIAWLRQRGMHIRFDRSARQTESPMPTQFLFDLAHGFSPRLLRYNAGLLFRSRAPHFSYRVAQLAVRCLTWRSLGVISRVLQWIRRIHPGLSSTRCPS